MITLPRIELTQANIDLIQEIVCKELKIDVAMVKVRTRKRKIVEARQISIYFIMNMIRGITLQRTADSFYEGCDHATPVHSIKVVTNFYTLYLEYREKIDRIGLALALTFESTRLALERKIVILKSNVDEMGNMMRLFSDEPSMKTLVAMKELPLALNSLNTQITNFHKIWTEKLNKLSLSQ